MAAVAEIPSQLAAYHRDAVCGEAYLLGKVEIVDRLHETYNAYLKQVVYVLAPSRKALYNAEHKAEIALYEPVSCVFAARFAYLFQQLDLLVLFEYGQLGSVYPCDDYFIICHYYPSVRYYEDIIARMRSCNHREIMAQKRSSVNCSLNYLG